MYNHGTDRRSYDQEWLDSSSQSTVAPFADPLRLMGRWSSPGSGPSPGSPSAWLSFGRVVEGFPYLNCYKVQLEGNSTLVCSSASMGSFSPMGTRRMDVYSPMQEVVVLRHSSAEYGIILCALPAPSDRPNDWRADTIFSGSNVGYFAEWIHNFWSNNDDLNSLADFSSGRPYDSTSGEENGIFATSGICQFVDEFMIMMKVDEETGVFGFYDDGLLRVTGHNLQLRATGMESEYLDDEGELNYYRGYTPYYWEAMGLYQPNLRSAYDMDEINQGGEGSPGDEEENMELVGLKRGFRLPIQYDQQPFHRTVEYGGYYGQGGREAVFIPGPEAVDRTYPNTYESDIKWLSLLEEQKTLAGRYTLTTADGIYLIKRPPRPAPKRRERPESTLGDLGVGTDGTEANYHPTGILGELYPDQKKHYIQSEIPLDDLADATGDPPAEIPEVVLRSAAVLDEVAYSVAWEGLHPFHYHSKDFYLAQESDLDVFNTSRSPSYQTLGKNQYLGDDEAYPWPDSVVYNVDHRYGTTNLYLNTAFICIRNDGSIVIRAADGCEARTEAGNWDFSAPGDIRFRSGRNLVFWAGHDMICRARDSMDFTTTRHDIYMMAHRNFMMCSGMEGEGGTIIENYADCVIDPEEENSDVDDFGESIYNFGEEVKISGILLKSPKAQITTSSLEANIEVGRDIPEDEQQSSSGGTSQTTKTYDPGRIRLYAYAGQIELFSHYQIEYITDSPPAARGNTTEEEGALVQTFMKLEEPDPDSPLGNDDNTCFEDELDDPDHPPCFRVQSVNEYRQDRITFCPTVIMDHELFVGGCAYFRGNTFFFGTMTSNEFLHSTNGQLSTDRSDVLTQMGDTDTRCNQTLPSLVATFARRFLLAVSGAWIDFSLRTVDQYGTKDAFAITENFWQHQVRVDIAAGLELPEGLVYWEEKPIKIPYAEKEKVAPYPGKKYSSKDDGGDGGGFALYVLNLNDEEEGRPKDRDGDAPNSNLKMYEDPKIDPGFKADLATRYLVVDPPSPADDNQGA